MAERSVLVTLRANVSGLKAGMATAKQSVREVNQEIGKSAKQNRQDFTQLGMAAGAAGAAIAVGLGKAVATAIDFDREMSGVAAASGATAGEMEKLRQAAIDAGAATAFSAGESAQAQVELAKAGVATADVLGGGLKGALDLAAAGQLGVAESAEIAATAMTQFNLEGSDVGHVADLLASGANKAQGGVGDLGAALNQSGLVASQFGLTLEETVGTLSAFASSGMVGSDAGTSFRAMLLRLANPTDEVTTLLDDLGIAAYDSQGAFVGMESLAGQLQDSLGGLTQAQRDQSLALIFGQDAIRGANILMSQGEQGIRDWTSAVDDQGAASRTAGILLDNLSGDWEAFTGSVETAQIEFGEEADGILRSTVQMATGMVNTLGGLPDPVQKAAVGVGALTSAVGLAGGGFLIAAPRIVETKKALDTLVQTMPRTVGGLRSVGSFLMGPWGVAFAAGTAAMVAWSKQADRSRQATADFYQEIQDNAQLPAMEQLDDSALTAQFLEERIAAEGLQLALRDTGLTVGDLARQIEDGALERDAFGFVRVAEESARSTAPFRDAVGALSVGMFDARTDAQQLNDVINELAPAMDRAASAAESDARGQALLADGLSGAATGMRTAGELTTWLTGETSLWARQVEVANQQVGQSVTATGDFRQALAGAGTDTQAFGQGIQTYMRMPLDELTTALHGMSDPIGAYTGLLSQKEAAERTSAEETAAATESMDDSWETYYADQSVSVSEWIGELEVQAVAQEEWATNMQILATRVSQTTLDQLSRLGPEGAPLVADLVNASDDELSRLDDVMATQTDAAIGTLESRIQGAREVGERFGKETSDAINQKLADGVVTAADIAWAYQESLRTGVNPLLLALGGESIPAQARALNVPTGVMRNTGGLIPGGGPNRDTVPAMLTTGEYVVQRPAVQRQPQAAWEALNEGRADIVPHYNAGGRVTGDVVGLHPEFMRRLMLWSASLGTPYNVGSGYRSMEEQAVLYDRWIRKVPGQAPAAPPGKSNHNFGLASDGPHWGSRNPGGFGLRYPMSYEPWHVEPLNAKAMRGSAGVVGFSLPDPPKHPFSAAVGKPLDATMSKAKDTAQKWMDEQFMFPAMNVPGGPESSDPSSPVPAGGNKALGQQMNAAAGWGNYWSQLNTLWDIESGWRTDADNPKSSAYGIPQALIALHSMPAGYYSSKTGSGANTQGYGGDPRVQIAWGLDYIAGKYGNPAVALDFHRGHNWYNQGGQVGTPDNPHVRDTGGPLLPGYTYNGTGRPESVVPFNVGGAVGARSPGIAGWDPINSPMGVTDAIAQAAEIRGNLEAIRIEGLDARTRLAEIADEMQRVVHGSDAWVELYREAGRLEDEVAAGIAATAKEQQALAEQARRDAEELAAERRRAREEQRRATVQAAQDRARDAQQQLADVERIAQARNSAAQQTSADAERVAQQIHGELNAALDRKEQLTKERIDAVKRYADAVAETRTRAAGEIDRLITAREDTLFNFAPMDQRTTPQWGNTAGALTGNITDQVKSFDQWADGIDRLRKRGLSEGLISALGLDDPAQVGQVQLLTKATKRELDDLAGAYERRSSQASRHAQRESRLLLGALGESVAEVRKTTSEAINGKDGLRDQLDADLSRIAREARMIGLDTGRSYGAAMQAGMRSGLPGVVAMAQEFRQALADAKQAERQVANVAKRTAALVQKSERNATIAERRARVAANKAAWWDERARNIPTNARMVAAAPQQSMSGPFELVMADGAAFPGWIRQQSTAARRQEEFTKRLQGSH